MGAEGTLGVITDVTLRIFRLAPFRLLEALAFDSVEAGVLAMRVIMQAGLRPFLVRFYDRDEARHAMQDPATNQCVMFLGFEGLESVARAEYAAALELCRESGGHPVGAAPVEAWMARRYDFSTVENLLAEPGGLAETIEVAHFWDRILETYQALKRALAPFADEVLGHFSHVYPHGTSLYIILLGRVADDAQAEEVLLKVWDTAMAICVSQGAAISHHHGAGLARQPYVGAALGTSHTVLQRIKGVLDPAGIMNPGKLGLE
jgi:alkyldihydroxyacetonephosphate synthase